MKDDIVHWSIDDIFLLSSNAIMERAYHYPFFEAILVGHGIQRRVILHTISILFYIWYESNTQSHQRSSPQVS